MPSKKVNKEINNGRLCKSCANTFPLIQSSHLTNHSQRTAQVLAKEIEIKDKYIVELETGAEALMEQIQYWKNKDRSKIGNTKMLSMKEVATKLSLTLLAGQNNLWRSRNSVFTITDNNFSIPNSSATKESNNPLDLIMIINECSFPEAILWLNEQFGEEVTVQMTINATREMIRNTPVPKITFPQSYEDKWPNVQ